MKQVIIMVLLFFVLITSAYAIEECKGTMLEREVPCIVLLPNNISSTPCGSIIATFYSNATLLHSNPMDNYTSFMCNTTFNVSSYGTYSTYFSTGDTATFVVQEDFDNRYYLYLVALIFFVVLLVTGYFLKEKVFVTLAGMTAVVTAINLAFNGFPLLTNSFLKNGVVIVLVGVGLYLLIAPYVEEMEGMSLG